MKFNAQASQDLFVLTMTNYKKNGTFVEIGSNEPIHINNTYILEKEFDWRGIMIEYENKYLESYKKYRPNSFHIIDDAQNIDYKKAFEDANLPTSIDYLQIDLEVDNKSTLNTLLKLDSEVMNTYNFAVITFEHDIYRGNHFDTRKISRDILEKRGYIRLFSDVKNENAAFEDWYVFPSLIEHSILSKITPLENIEHAEIAKLLIQHRNTGF